MKRILQNAPDTDDDDDDDGDDSDHSDMEDVDLDTRDAGSDVGDGVLDTSSDVRDAVGKALALIKQISTLWFHSHLYHAKQSYRFGLLLKPMLSSINSARRLEYLRVSSCYGSTLGGLHYSNASIGYCTYRRYVTSLYLLDILTCFQAVNRFTQLADDSDDIPRLRGKKYSNFKLSKKDWDRLAIMHEVL
jgi:hypothetical protein